MAAHVSLACPGQSPQKAEGFDIWETVEPDNAASCGDDPASVDHKRPATRIPVLVVSSATSKPRSIVRRDLRLAVWPTRM